MIITKKQAIPSSNKWTEWLRRLGCGEYCLTFDERRQKYAFLTVMYRENDLLGWRKYSARTSGDSLTVTVREDGGDA